ncbi:PH domain-containing protein [Kangiella sediminilitoris]|uniref:Membrane-flanked domain protein n=1 Tax=Kangiella sediminilitoris TaxID=1144748 RepID=A0A1B3B7P7_9GAMM|nr:PH domain-containing protein [Kangiella sediminilitoris]AOE48807.1 Membrane-flanked domain protein [Kangiella sediminilitoris]
MPEITSLTEQRPSEAKRLHSDSIKASRIAHAIFCSILLLGAIVVSFIAENWLIGSIAAGAVVLIFLMGFIWAKKSYQYTWYWLTDEGLHIQHGVIWRNKTLVPRNRIQHTDVSQGPLQRRYKLSKFIVYTAGTRDASVPIDGLLIETANDLRQELRQEGDSDAV